MGTLPLNPRNRYISAAPWLLLTVMVAAQEHPRTILQINREPLLPGGESTYRAIEDQITRDCITLGCPHPFLGLETLTGPKEVWWLNAFDSEAHRQRVTDAYEKNAALMEALQRNSARKASVTGQPVNSFVTFRRDLSRDAPWSVAGARFFVVTRTRRDAPLEGQVFEAPDGVFVVFRAVVSRDEAEAIAKSAGAEATLLAVRPYWGMPAKEWIAADPEFWKPNPQALPRNP